MNKAPKKYDITVRKAVNGGFNASLKDFEVSFHSKDYNLLTDVVRFVANNFKRFATNKNPRGI